MIRGVLTACSIWTLAFLLATTVSYAQEQDIGPMKPPTVVRLPSTLPANRTEPPPPIPPAEIIARFAANEEQMLRSSAAYTFEKSVRLEEIGPDNRPTGQVEVITQQIVGPDGKSREKIVRRVASTLHYLQMERGDLNPTLATPLFPLTTSQLPKYEIRFEGKQPLDELQAYIFAVKPRNLDRTHAYFSGVVWVDEQDLVIVKTIGKWISETGDVTFPELPFTVFETYRQQLSKTLWVPAYSRSDESVQQGGVRVPIRLTIRWSGYAPASSGAPPDASAGSLPAAPASKP